MRVEGDYQGQRISLWASMISGSEIIFVGGKEVSRKRSFRFSTVHDLRGAGLDVDRAVVKMFPLRFELHRGSELVATFRYPRPWLVGIMLAAAGALLGFLLGMLLAD